MWKDSFFLDKISQRATLDKPAKTFQPKIQNMHPKIPQRKSEIKMLSKKYTK